MPYCSRCGVEVEEKTVSCPLCDSPIQHLDSDNRPVSYYPKDVPPEWNDRRNFHRGAFTLFLSILFFIPIAITVTADLITNLSVTWSAIPVFSLISAWGMVFIITHLYRSPIALGFAIFADLALFLFAMAQIIPGGKEWFLPLGLSIAAVSFLAILILVLFFVFSATKGFNIIGAVMLTAAVLTFFIDLFVSRYLSETGEIALSWSLYVVFSCIPLSLFCFYLHYIKHLPLKFKRIFHL